jgi:hypothetical protein
MKDVSSMTEKVCLKIFGLIIHKNREIIHLKFFSLRFDALTILIHNTFKMSKHFEKCILIFAMQDNETLQ